MRERSDAGSRDGRSERRDRGGRRDGNTAQVRAKERERSKERTGRKRRLLPEDFPTSEQLERELKQVRYRSSYAGVLKSTIYMLITVAAAAVLVAVLLLPVLQIYGTSMQPTLKEGDIVVSVKGGRFRTGDVIAFYYNNKILVKRVIASPGDWVDIDKDGTVYVNNVQIEEPYLTDRAYGEVNIDLPYQVPESRIFVMGDNRSTSIDSRNTAVGCVAQEQIVGRIAYCLWPLSDFGSVG